MQDLHNRQAARRAPASRRRRLLLRILLAVLLAPTAIIALYRHVPPPVTPLMLLRAAEGEGLAMNWRPIEEIAAALPRAVIAAEDNLFCRHRGFDLDALRHEIDRALAGERSRGASTITMQTAKNILLWPGRDPVRKVLEAALAPQLELFWNKRRILEIYLNIAELGPGIYGAEAAARHWFGKPAGRLTRREAALLAAILPNPRRWSPRRPTRHIADRARTIERRMDQLGPLLDCAP